jgi:hypothetical protein
MEQQQSHQEELARMYEMNITKFLESARKYLFGMIVVRQPVLATIPVRQVRR